MHEPTYRQAITQSWRLVWHHKGLWIVGLISVFLGQFGLSNFIGQLIAKVFFSEASWWPASWGAIHIATFEQFLWFLWALVVVVAIALFVICAAVCAEGAILIGAVHWYKFRTLPKLMKAWRQGVKHFWSILIINFLEKILLAAILAVAVEVVKLFSAATVVGLFGEIVVIAVSLVLALIITTVSIYALGYTVIDNKGIIDAVDKGWQLFLEHLLVSLELSLLLVCFNVVLIILLSAVAFLVLIPSFFISTVAGFTGLLNLVTVSVVAYAVLFIVIAAWVGGIFNAFTTSAWMYLFMKMHHEGVGSRIFHYARRLAGKK